MSTLVLRSLLGSLLLVILAGGLALADDDALPTELQSRLDALPDDPTRIELLAKEAKDRPSDPILQFHLANLYFDTGQLEQAAAHYERAVDLDPGHLGALVNLGSVYDEMGRLDQAMSTYRKALEIEPNEARTLCNIGGVYFKKRRFEQAMTSFLQALEVDPESQLAHYNLAILFADSGIYEEAVAEWEAAVRIDPESDLGQRSRDNIQIIRQMQESELPPLEETGSN